MADDTFVTMCRKKLRLDYEDLVKLDYLEKQLADLQISINELQAWHSRTSNASETNRNRHEHTLSLSSLDYPSEK